LSYNIIHLATPAALKGVYKMRGKAIKFASVLITLLVCLTIVGTVSAKTSSSENASASEYWKPVEKAMGENGKISPDGAIKFTIPMTLNVTLDGIKLYPASERSHDFDFMRAGDKAMMVGEIGVTEEEVKNVSTMALRSGLQVTAIHNHLLRTSPHIMWIHIYGYGDPVDMAKKILSITDYVNGGSSASESEKFHSKGINTTELDRIIGDKGSAEGGDYNYDISRADKIQMNGYELSPVMDVSTMINFQPLGNGSAAVIGEFVLETNEVEPVVQILTENDIEVTALHSHMLTEQPRLFYVHCWATGDATELAGIMRDALNETNSKTGNESS
jgi:hypothetical protein